MPCGWEGNRRSGVALAKYVTDFSSGLSIYELKAQEREMSTLLTHSSWGIAYFTFFNNSWMSFLSLVRTEDP